jgi:hypothetical protein
MERHTTVDSNHILCGRGNSIYNSEGNKIFRRIIERHLCNYINSTRSKKTELIKRVSEELQNLGMIFMAVNDEGEQLQELPTSEARKKVAHRFRDAVRTVKHDDMNMKRIMMKLEKSEALEYEDSENTENFSSSMAEHFHSHTQNHSAVIRKHEAAFCPVSSTDSIPEETMITWRHTETPVLHPETRSSVFPVENTEDILPQCQTFSQHEVITDDIFDVFEILDAHDPFPDFDYWDEIGDVSLLLSGMENLIEAY